jgi:hypothetical protein
MMSRWKAALLCGSAILAPTAGALAQDTPPPPVPAGQAAQPTPGQTPLYDPRQLPAQRGQVQQFTMTPRGDIDGLILSDGTEVKTPPHLSAEIAYSIKPGETAPFMVFTRRHCLWFKPSRSPTKQLGAP